MYRYSTVLCMYCVYCAVHLARHIEALALATRAQAVSLQQVYSVPHLQRVVVVAFRAGLQYVLIGREANPREARYTRSFID